MSRYCGTDTNSEPILRAAARWRDDCLLAGRSILGQEPLWQPSFIREIDTFFVQRPDMGSGTFLEKLEYQLRPSSPQAKRLAAEMMWILYLCPSSITASHKRQTLGKIWGWSGESIPDSEWLSDDVLAGVGSAGMGFNTNLWRELVFCVRFADRLLTLAQHERDQVLSNGWHFAEWLKRVPEWEARQFRHMLLFLLFPDDFERVFGGTDRRAIAAKFSGQPSRIIRRLDPLQLDRLLRDVRLRLEGELKTSEVDFYTSPLKERWSGDSLETIIPEISAEHVNRALAEIDRNGVTPGAESTGYDLVKGGRRYPPKLVVALAAKYAGGEELDRGTFAGGAGTPAFNLLRELGFEVEPKDLIKETLERFLAQASEGTSLVVQGYPETYRGLTIKVSFGVGNISRIPWIAFLGPGQAVSNGIYPVFLYFKEEKQLLLCYGISETNQPDHQWNVDSNAQTVREWFQKNLGRTPARYGASYVYAAYSAESALPFDDIRLKVDEIIDRYKSLLKGFGALSDAQDGGPKAKLEIVADLAAATSAFAAALRAAHLDYGSGHDELVRAFIASMVAKPFVILTGLSGSGKTQLAMRFGEWLGHGRLCVVAVRPDWTGAEAVFGYEDALKPLDDDGRAAWVVPQTLEFILKAAADPAHPHLLLLDEMNLAHVERYFADMLSGMESSKACVPNLTKGPDSVWRCRSSEERTIPFPKNLWIVGTVNVDETTYMFSPKVLDRANTFEFRVTTSSLIANAHKPGVCQPGDQRLVRGLLEVAKSDSWHQENPAEAQDEVVERLRQLHAVLSRYGMEFGHRLFYESLRFASLYARTGAASAAHILDRVVLQKILPRLHGARRRLELPLLALMHFAKDLPEQVATDEQLPTLTGAEGRPALPSVHEKLSRMLRSLQTNQFATFAE